MHITTMEKHLEEPTDDDRAEIARLIADGFDKGILDNNGYRMVWSLDIDKFKH